MWRKETAGPMWWIGRSGVGGNVTAAAGVVVVVKKGQKPAVEQTPSLPPPAPPPPPQQQQAQSHRQQQPVPPPPPPAPPPHADWQDPVVKHERHLQAAAKPSPWPPPALLPQTLEVEEPRGSLPRLGDLIARLDPPSWAGHKMAYNDDEEAEWKKQDGVQR